MSLSKEFPLGTHIQAEVENGSRMDNNVTCFYE